MAYFKKFTPKKGNTSTFDVEMPAAEYQIIAVSGEAEKQKGVKDHFDNIAIDISGENTRLDPVLGADPGATVVLGEELSKITRITDDGSREPIPGALPSTADSGKYLYPEAYIKYHPMSRNPNAEIDRDKRSFRVKPGRQYIFRAKISGIDNGGRIIISHGKKKEVVHFTQAAIVRIEKNHIETKKPPRPSNGAAVDKWANLAGKGIVPERFIMETEIKDHRGVVMGVIGQDPEGNKFKIWVDNINDEYFVSCFRFNEKRDLFEMQKRVHTGDWLSAWSIFRSYTRARWMKTLDFELIDRNRSGRNWFLTSDERTKKKSDKKTSAHLSRGTSIARGSKKLIEISFTPKKSTISIEFESTGNHYHCDEIRFDDIGVTEIDGKTGEAKGDVIRAYK